MKTLRLGLVWWYLVILVLGRLRQEDQEFKVILGQHSKCEANQDYLKLCHKTKQNEKIALQ